MGLAGVAQRVMVNNGGTDWTHDALLGTNAVAVTTLE